jgi:hypothetical protein
MPKAASIALILALGLASARADSLKVGRLDYSRVKVTGFSNGRLLFVLGPNLVSKPIEEITSITIDEKPVFNEAEQLRVREPAKAVGLYDKALQSVWTPWEKRMISYRCVDALGRAGLTDRWAREWTALMADSEGAGAVNLRPAKLGDRSQVSAAVGHLDGVLKQSGDSNVRAAISLVLEQMRGRTGSEPPGTTERPAVRNGQRQPELPTSPRVAEPVAPASGGVGQLQTFGTMIANGQAAKAVEEIDRYLERASWRDLGRAMFLGGVARLKVVETTRSRSALAEAAVMFMKVAEFFPSSSDAPQALFLAAQASEALDDKIGAASAYSLVGQRYQGTAFARRAEESLKRLKAEQATPKTESKPAEKP